MQDPFSCNAVSRCNRDLISFTAFTVRLHLHGASVSFTGRSLDLSPRHRGNGTDAPCF
jgi:hypothetical protein